MKKLTRLVPPWETADYGRYLFKQALRKETPGVLKSLADDVLPAYLAITPEIARQSYKPAIHPTVHARSSGFIAAIDGNQLPLYWWSIQAGTNESLEAAELKSKLWKWAERFHLSDEWLLDVAAQTLYFWRERKDQNEIGSSWGHLPTQVFSSIGLDECEFELPADAWDLDTEQWEEFETRVTEELLSRLAAYKERILSLAIDRGYERAPIIKNEEHFRWLALYQVQGSSPKDIANHFRIEIRSAENIQNTVLKAVRQKAKLISLTLRDSKAQSRKKNVN